MTIPGEWVQELGGGEVFFGMLEATMGCYRAIRDALLVFEGAPRSGNAVSLSVTAVQGQKKPPVGVAREYMSSLRQLLLSLASISSSCAAVFPSDEQRGAYVDFIVRETVPLLSSSMMYLCQSEGVVASIPDGLSADSVGELCAQECEHLLFSLIRVFGKLVDSSSAATSV